MIVSFEENGKSYEVQNDHIDEIFEKVKVDIQKIFDQYEQDGKDCIIALMAMSSITKDLMQWASNEYGVDEIIKTVKGKEILKGEK